MARRTDWNGYLSLTSDHEDSGLPVAVELEQRRAARTVAAAATDLDDLRELLAMLGLDQLPREPSAAPADRAG